MMCRTVLLLWAAACSMAFSSDDPWPPDSEDLIVLVGPRPLKIRLRIEVDGRPFRLPWQERWDYLADAADEEGDGQFTAAEAVYVAKRLAGIADPAEAGAVRGTEALVAAQGNSVSRTDLYRYLSEAVAPLTLSRGPVDRLGAAPALVNLLDTDGDGRLSGDELSAAFQQLRLRDFSDDGLLTAGELVVDPTLANETTLPADGVGRLLAAGPVFAVPPSAPTRLVASAILQTYDRDSDGRLQLRGTQPELHFESEELLQEFDADDDGQLSLDELGRWRTRRPDLELPIALGSSVPTRGRSNRVPAPEGVRVRSKILGGYQIAMGDAEIVVYRNNRLPSRALRQRLRFATLDSDQNGYLDERETEASPLLAGSFSELDRDHDGEVAAEELDHFIEQQQAADATRLLLSVYDYGHNLLALLDADLDGRLSPRELQQAVDLIALHDANGDQLLGESEIPRLLRLELVRGVRDDLGPARRARGARSGRQQEQTAGPLWFQRMDRNSDGDLQRREFLGSRQLFDRLDANGDRLLDAAEAEAAGKE